MNSLGVLQLGDCLGYCRDVEEIGEVGVPGQSVALVAFYQDLYSGDSGNVRGQRLDQRNHTEFFDQDAGAVTVGEGGVEVDDGESGIDQVDVANFRSGA